MTYEQILQTVNVAFNEKVRKVLKKSYNKTIDVQYGIYEDGRLTINLKPSHGWRDWLINFCAFGKMHYGYRAEFQKYGGDILSTIYSSKELWEASRNGTIIAGRSKGELPPKEEPVLCFLWNGNYCVAFKREDDEWTTNGRFTFDGVKCWQYIVPPKEEA